MPRISLLLGTGMCGFQAAVDLLNRQLDCTATFLNSPFLPWDSQRCLPQQLENRLQRLRQKAAPDCQLVVDAGWFYLPYVEQLLQLEPDVQFACLQRPQAEVVDAFVAYLKRNYPLPTTYWQIVPPDGWQNDPVLTRTYPEIEASSLQNSVAAYWKQYDERATQLASRYPDRFRLFDCAEALDDHSGQQQFLEFLGIVKAAQRILLGRWENDSPPMLPRLRPTAPRPKTNDPLEPCRCLVIVPHYSKISLPCQQSLKQLERKGYFVRRVQGYAAIDQARNQLATDAIIDGFEETLWVDPDCLFHPDDVDHLRAWQLPVCTANEVDQLPATPSRAAELSGKLRAVNRVCPLLFHVRRQAFSDMQHRLASPICNERFRHPVIPYFRPMRAETSAGQVYLNDLEAFSQRLLQAGHKIQSSQEILVSWQ